MNPIEHGFANQAAVLAKLKTPRRLPAALPGGVREPGDQQPARRPGDRELRAHAALPRRADRPLPRRRRQGHLGVGAARLGALQREGALQHLSRAHRRAAALHRRPVPQHRRRREADRLPRGRAQGRGGRGGRQVRRRARPRQRRGERARPLPGDPRAEGHGRLQDAAAPQRRAHRPLHARRQRGHAARA